MKKFILRLIVLGTILFLIGLVFILLSKTPQTTSVSNTEVVVATSSLKEEGDGFMSQIETQTFDTKKPLDVPVQESPDFLTLSDNLIQSILDSAEWQSIEQFKDEGAFYATPGSRWILVHTNLSDSKPTSKSPFPTDLEEQWEFEKKVLYRNKYYTLEGVLSEGGCGSREQSYFYTDNEKIRFLRIGQGTTNTVDSNEEGSCSFSTWDYEYRLFASEVFTVEEVLTSPCQFKDVVLIRNPRVQCY